MNATIQINLGISTFSPNHAKIAKSYNYEFRPGGSSMRRPIQILILVALLICSSNASFAYWGLAGSSTSDTASIFIWDWEAGDFVFSDPIDLGQYGNYPYDAVMRPQYGEEIWIPGASGDGVVVIDEFGNITHEIPTNEYPVSIAFNPRQDIALVSCRDGDNLDIIDLNTYEVIGSLPIPGTYLGPGNIVYDVLGHRFFLVAWYDDILFEISDDGASITDQVDLGDNLWQLSIDPNFGGYLYVTDRGTDQVRVIDPETMLEVQTIDVGDDPWGIDVDEPFVVVACEDSGDVYKIDSTTWEVQHIALPAGSDPRDVSIATGWMTVGGREVLGAAAYVAGGRTVSGDPLYVIDLYDGTIMHDLDVPGTNTNVVAVEAQWHLPSSVDELPFAVSLQLEVAPNPFNPRTQVKFHLETAAQVRLCVFDVSGRLVQTLVAESMEPGQHTITWDGRDRGGRRSPSGTYLVMVQAGDLLAGQKVVLVQ